jgi:putative copper resistance protein D
VLKLILFAGMLYFAARNRLKLNPQFGAALRAGNAGDQEQQRLKQSVLAETALGLLVLAVVGWMGTLEPPVAGG